MPPDFQSKIGSKEPKNRQNQFPLTVSKKSISIIIYFCWAICSFAYAETKETNCDVVVYGGTPAGVIAAVELARLGKSVVLIEPGKHLGGMLSSGLGFSDYGKKYTIGGLSREFFHRLWLYYENKKVWRWEPMHFDLAHPEKFEPKDRVMWTFEPHAAEKVFCEMAFEAKVSLVFEERLERKKGVIKKGPVISSITMESGRCFAAKVFIDATYEGDLLASAGVTYTVGRESNSQYGETLNGIHPNFLRGNMPHRLDPYLIKGNPKSGLLPRISPSAGGASGTADQGVQAYNYRMCLTNVAENCVKIKKPDGYDEKMYEMFLRAIEGYFPKEHFFKLDPIPNRKTDSNNCCGLSTDFVGMSWNYAEADYKTRKEIAKAHEHWQRGLLWTLQNHPRVPKKIRDYFAPWGLPKDEFVENQHWPFQLYIREARRMVSDCVITEQVALGHIPIKDPIAFASYSLDSHAIKYFAAPDGYVATEGCFYHPVVAPFPISYGAIVPKKNECANLLVPVCLSSSHVAYGSIRMESVFMMLGQAAGIAASLAVDLTLPVQELSYEKLRKILIKRGQTLQFFTTDSKSNSRPER